MSVSKKDFIAIAHILANSSSPNPSTTPRGKPTLLHHFTTDTYGLVGSLCSYFLKQNPQFDEQRFIAAVRSGLGMRPQTPPSKKS